MEDNFIKLYDIVNPLSEDRTPLYFQGDFKIDGGEILIESGNSLDCGTYFNAFSLKKWVDYTNLSRLEVELNLEGKFSVEFYGMAQSGEENFLTLDAEGNFNHSFEFDELQRLSKKFDLLGMKLTAKNSAKFLGGSYCGKFSSIRDVHIGITICTFKREKYLLPNIEKLETLTARNSDFSIMVIDNGQTLGEKHSDALQILPNPNYGGSGGFTRGLMEQVSQGRATHVILSDDDTVLELSAFDRLYSFLRGLKDEHEEKFFAGAMLSLEKPTMQVENTGRWNKINGKSFGKGFVLTNKAVLCENEQPPKDENSFAGWWFCCVPVKSVKKIGYPLPVFIKGDDIEYSVRNGAEILTMNGVGVWHEVFVNKLSPAIQYFGDRNMLLLNHLMNGCGRFTFMLGCVARIVRWIKESSPEGLRMLEPALRDLSGGFEGITALPSDEKFAQIRAYPLDKNIFSAIVSTLWLGLKYFFSYDEHDAKVKKFVNEKLSDQRFWRDFLDKKI